MSDSTLELDAALREKEELIHALTERLELTAEQLDRMQRTNGDRGHWRSAGVPAELVEQQQSLCSGLERLLEQWEAAQPNLALERIESQLLELRQMMSPHHGDGVAFLSSTSRTGEADATKADAAELSGGTPAWEALKAELLARESGDEGEVAPVPLADSPVADGPDPFCDEPLHAPAPIELETASRDELVGAVLERDELIIELSKRLRTVEGRTRPGDGWKALEALPDELKTRVESLERRLEQMLRLGEVELSLERAKLSREAARIRQMEASMPMGGSAVAATRDDSADEKQHPAASGEGRWLRMLGMTRDR